MKSQNASDTEPVHQHLRGIREARALGIESLNHFTEALRAQPGFDQRMEQYCAEHGVDFEAYHAWIARASGIHWKTNVDALVDAVTHNPGALVIAVLGERWVPDRSANQSYKDWVLGLDLSTCVTQIADLTDRYGSPFSVWTTGGVRMKGPTTGELPADELARIVRTALGKGIKRVRLTIDMESMHTGDQGNNLGAMIANALAANPFRKIILCPVLPAAHNARFIATLLAGVEKMLPAVLRGRAHLDAKKRGVALLHTNGTTNLDGLRSSLLVIPMTTGTMRTHQPQRKMSMGEEAFGHRQTPAQAIFVSNTLGAELAERYIREAGPEGQSYTCPAFPPEIALLFLTKMTHTIFREIREASEQPHGILPTPAASNAGDSTMPASTSS